MRSNTKDEAIPVYKTTLRKWRSRLQRIRLQMDVVAMFQDPAVLYPEKMSFIPIEQEDG
jgi:hypothetical protein